MSKKKPKILYNTGELPDKIVIRQQKMRLKSLQGGIIIEDDREVVYVKKESL